MSLMSYPWGQALDEGSFQNLCKDYLSHHLYANAAYILELLEKTDVYVEWENIYNEETDEYAEIAEYWLISEDLYNHLKDLGEPVLSLNDNDLFIWGRITCGQSTYIDGEIRTIVKEIFRVKIK